MIAMTTIIPFYLVKTMDAGKRFFYEQHEMSFEEAVEEFVDRQDDDPRVFLWDEAAGTIVDQTFQALDYLAAKSFEKQSVPDRGLRRLMRQYGFDFYEEPDWDAMREDQEERRRFWREHSTLNRQQQGGR